MDQEFVILEILFTLQAPLLAEDFLLPNMKKILNEHVFSIVAPVLHDVLAGKVHSVPEWAMA